MPAARLAASPPFPAPGLWAQFWSHSPASGTVHERPPRSSSGRSRTVADLGERWCALLESVLASQRGNHGDATGLGLEERLPQRAWPCAGSHSGSHSPSCICVHRRVLADADQAERPAWPFLDGDPCSWKAEGRRFDPAPDHAL